MTTPLIAGVDVSTKLVAIALLDAHTGALKETLELRCDKGASAHPSMPRDSAYRLAADTLNTCTHVYIEEPFGKYSVELGNRALGALLARITVPVTLYGPTKWKALAGIPGNADKGLIRMAAYKRHKKLWANGASVSQDLCDALIIARAGWNDHTGASRLAENA